MSKHHSFIDTIDQVITDGVRRGLGHLSTEDTVLKGNTMRLKGRDVVNFGVLQLFRT